jgi:hypothetical protein
MVIHGERWLGMADATYRLPRRSVDSSGWLTSARPSGSGKYDHVYWSSTSSRYTNDRLRAPDWAELGKPKQ